MATLTNCTLTIDKVPTNESLVRLTVAYTLTPNQVERLAGTVFTGVAQIRRDDPGVLDDLTVATINDTAFAVSSSTTSVTRTVSRTVSKAVLDEDPGTNTEGAEIEDEVFARAVATYVANAPTPPPVIAPADSTVHRGAWTS